MKKVVVIGGGTGMSNLLSGLKQFPLDITAIVTVCDDGGSTGILREENILHWSKYLLNKLTLPLETLGILTSNLASAKNLCRLFK